MNFKLLKLNNGEEIIGEIEETETSLIVKNPMVFIVMTMTDTSGVPMNVTMLKDWLNNSDNKTATIDKSKIIVSTEPNKKTLDYYIAETSKPKISNPPSQEMDSVVDEMGKLLDQMIEDSLNGINGNYEPLSDQIPKKKKKKKRHNPDMVDDPQMIYLSMMIPPEALMNMVTSGIIDPEAIQIMIEETKKKNRFTGDEKTRKDFGNKYTDWNPDPKSDDYS